MRLADVSTECSVLYDLHYCLEFDLVLVLYQLVQILTSCRPVDYKAVY